MKRFAAFALLLAGMAIPNYGQHAGAHGGIAGHSGGGAAGHAGVGHTGFGGSRFSHVSPPRFGGSSQPGFRPSAPNRPIGIPRPPMTNHFYGARPYNPPSTRFRSTNGNFRPEYSRDVRSDHRDHDRDPYRHRDHDRRTYGLLVPYYLGNPYAYSYLGYPYDFGFGDYGAYDDSSNSQGNPYYGPDYGPDQYNRDGAYPPDGDYDQDRPDYGAAYQPYYGSSSPAQEPADEKTVTLVFKDHRPDEQIHNYLLNGNVLSVWDQHPRDIPVNQLDLAATERVNRDAGVDFHLPRASR